MWSILLRLLKISYCCRSLICKKDPLFLKISGFVQTMEAYNTYLSNHMRPMNDHRADTYVPLHREDNISWAAEFQENTLNFRRA